MTDGFKLSQVSSNQNNKETTINTAIGQLAQAMGNELSLDLTAGHHTLIDTEFLRNVYFLRSDTTAARHITIDASISPAPARFFFFANSAVSTDLIRGSTTITAAASEIGLYYTDGTANSLIRIFSSLGAPVSSIPAALSLAGIISPTQLAANTNDWAPTGLSGAVIIRMSTDASRNLTGLTGGADGRLMIIENIGTHDVVFKDLVTSSASNQFSLGGADVTLTAKKTLLFFYDGTLSKWMLIGGTGSGSGATAFTGLSDVPASYSGNALKFLRANSGETALEFFEVPYTIPTAVLGVPTNSQLCQYFVAVEAFRIVASATGSQAKAGVASTGTVSFALLKNGSGFGTVTFTASGTGTFTVGSDTDFAAGDILTITAPASADATLANIGISLKGKRI